MFDAQVYGKKNKVKIINFIKDATLGLYVPVLEVDGNDGGISSSFDITTDLFATGDNKMRQEHYELIKNYTKKGFRKIVFSKTSFR